jgi:hypothetical protein
LFESIFWIFCDRPLLAWGALSSSIVVNVPNLPDQKLDHTSLWTLWCASLLRLNRPEAAGHGLRLGLCLALPHDWSAQDVVMDRCRHILHFYVLVLGIHSMLMDGFVSVQQAREREARNLPEWPLVNGWNRLVPTLEFVADGIESR